MPRLKTAPAPPITDAPLGSQTGDILQIPAPLVMQPEQISTEVFVPFDFAQSKVAIVAADYKATKDKYEKYIDQLNTYFRKIIDDTKNHYEKYINELRVTAISHIAAEVDRCKKKDVEMNVAIQRKDDEIDDLRDTNAIRIAEANASIRHIKQQTAENEKIRVECSKSLSDALRFLEINEHVSIRSAHEQSVKNKANEERRKTEEAQREYSRREKKAQLEAECKGECQAALSQILYALESNQLQSISEQYIDLYHNTSHRAVSTIETLERKIAQLLSNEAFLNSEKRRMEDESSARISAFQGDLAEAQLRCEAYNTQVEQMKMERQSLEDEDHSLRDEGVSLKRELDSLKATNKSITEEVETLKATNKSITEEVETLKATNKSMAEEKDASIRSVSDLEAELVKRTRTDAKKWEKAAEDMARLDVEVVLQELVAAVDSESMMEREQRLVAKMDKKTAKLTLALEASRANSRSLETQLQDLARQVQEAGAREEATLSELKAAMEREAVLTKTLQETEQRQAVPATTGAVPAPTSTKGISTSEKPTASPRVDPSIALRAEIAALKKVIDEKNIRHEQLKARGSTLMVVLDERSKAKNDSKNEIKIWMKNFEQENGRQPSNEEKVVVKDKFLAHKLATNDLQATQDELVAVDSTCNEVESELKALHEKREQLEKLLGSSTLVAEEVQVAGSSVPSALQMGDPPVSDPSAQQKVEPPTSDPSAQQNIDPPTSDPSTQQKVEPPASDAATNRIISPQANLNADGAKQETAVVVVDGASAEVIEGLQYTIQQLQDDIRDMADVVKALEMDKVELSKLLDNIRQEKRTDVVSRYEDEIQKLKSTLSDLQETQLVNKTEKTKLDLRLAELKERAERAELELKDRDAKALLGLSENDEKVHLTQQVGKQRTEIVMKSKAATAGWDAAADAEEKLSIEIEKAYNTGFKEGKAEVTGDLKNLHAAIEAKELRITELIEERSGLERRVVDSEVAAERAIRDSAIALARSQQAASKGGGGGGSGGGGEHSDEQYDEISAELKSSREMLDGAQEELIALSDRLNEAKEALSVAEMKIVIYEKLHSGALIGVSAPAAVTSADDATKGTTVSHPSLAQLSSDIRESIVTGTQLWKDDNKAGCYDLYASKCQYVSREVYFPLLKNPLVEALRSSEALPKPKGAVALRKALDQFLVGAAEPSNAAAEKLARESADTAATPPTTYVQSAPVSESAVSGLLSQLAALNAQDTISAKDVDNSGAATASILQRAQAAEAQLDEARKELAEAKMIMSNSRVPGARGKAALAGAPTGADPAEMKKLKTRIKELEGQLSGGGGGASEKKAVQAVEKKFEKQIKETEKNTRKEKAALESKLSGTEKMLESATAELAATSTERDQLKQRVKELSNMTAEMEVLSQKAAQADVYKLEIDNLNNQVLTITEQYKKESTLRKKYKNELEDLKGAIRVYARMRPMAKYEIERNCQQVIQFPDETSVKMATSRGEKEFEFDAAFRDDSTQEEVFEDTKRLVESCIDGFNVCLFAYGQTGSGKTFTMTGSPDNPGLTPKAIHELYRLIAEKKSLTVTVSTYFVELYNDSLVDLYWKLDNKKSREQPPKLDIKLDEKKVVQIKNAVIKVVASPDELFYMFTQGNMERHVGATKMNAESSRSHSIFAIMIESYDSNTKKTNFGKLSLVDLAGSERADKTGASADRLKEAQSINKSLSALGDVISALSTGEKFIPYRNNKLTQLMQDSLGGNAKTLMFVNFSPADYNADETATSLAYATRVKKITNNAAKQAESEEVAKLKAIIKKLMSGGKVAAEEVGEIGLEEGRERGGDEEKADEAQERYEETYDDGAKEEK